MNKSPYKGMCGIQYQGIVELNEVDVYGRNKRRPTCLYAWSSKGRCPVSRRDYEREMTVESMPRLSTEASWDRVEDVEASRAR